MYEDLEKLNDLKQKGIITEEEFNTKKKEILKGGQSTNNTYPGQPTPQIDNTLNPYWQKIFCEFDNLFNQAKKTGIIPGFSAFWKWNWAAFFFGGFWMLYKRQWAWFFFLLIPAIFTYGIIYSIAGGLHGNFFEYYKYRTGKSFFWTPKGASEDIMKTL